MTEGERKVRLDRWLNAARIFKNRQLAAAACAGGKVEVDGVSAKAHRPIGVGDRLEVKTPHGERILVVQALADKRLGPQPARELYIDETPPPPPEPEIDLAVPVRERGTGRPTKRDRRRLRDYWEK